jgi:hypothetical protein
MAEKKIAKYEGGGWVLPLEVANNELPASSEQVLSARLAELGPEALALAEALAVHSGAVPLAIALAMSELPGESRTYGVLDELLAEQVLVSNGDGYRFRHEAMREAVLARMGPATRKGSRLRAAEALLAFGGSGVAERTEAALHLIDAGEEHRGVRILIAAARDLGRTAGTHENVHKLVRGLCRLVRAYAEQGRSDYELGAVLFPLMPLAYHSGDWQFMLEFGERALELGLRITGLARAAELAPALGQQEALKRGLATGAAAFAEHAVESIGYDLHTAVSTTIGMTPACVAVYATCFDSSAVSRIARAVEPLTFFGEDHVAYGAYLIAAAETKILGSESESRPLWQRALARFEDPGCAKLMGEARTMTLKGAALFILGLLDSYQFGDGALVAALQMEKLGVKAWAISADQIRILYHSLRGESTAAKTYIEQLERNVSQGAQAWHAEVFWPALLLRADVLTGDAIAARRRYVQLERRSREVAMLKPQSDAARAAYLMLRGDLAGAIALYEEVLPSFPCRERVGWETTRAYFAKALNAAGQYERARVVAEEVLTNMIPPDYHYPALFLEPRRQLALAECGLGNHARAAALLDELLAKHGHESNPLLVGLLHQARAEVAERAQDLVAASAHRSEMERRFRKTQNPLLIAQCERADRAAAAYSTVRASRERYAQLPNDSLAAATVEAAIPSSEDASDVDVLSASPEPFQALVEYVIQQTSAKDAYLYVLAGDELRLAWSTANEEPHPSCLKELGRWLALVREHGRNPPTRDDRGPLLVHTISGYRLVALQKACEATTVGGLILEAEPSADLIGSTHIFEALGDIIEKRGLDVLGFITA